MPTLTEPLPIVAEPTTLPKPSEALRLGILAIPEQAFGPLAIIDADGPHRASWDRCEVAYVAACALGSMAIALGVDLAAHHAGGHRFWWHPAWSTFASVKAPCAGDGIRVHRCRGYREGKHAPALIVAHLNDDHQWDRARIAAWLESEGM